MNNKSVFKHLLLLVTALFVLGNISLAQVRTFYVDNQIGSDGYDGLATSVTLPANGPKLTIMNAIAAANSGDFISVKNTGVAYVENVSIVDGGVKKVLTIGSYGGGTPVVTGTLTLNNTTALPAANRVLAFNGPIQFSNGMTLTSGNIVGASNLTIGGTVTRTDLGSVDSQILVTGTVNYVYTNAANIVTGYELPATATIGTFTTNGGFKVTLDRNVTATGTLTVGAGDLDLGGYMYATNAAIVAGANNITNGTIAATAAAQTFTANNLPNITAGKTTTGLSTLTINAATTQALTASGNASVTATLSGGTGNTTALASVRGAVSNSGAGVVTLDRSAGATLWVAGNITLSGLGSIAVGGVNATAYNVNGNVTLSTAISTPANNVANLWFGSMPTTITGTVANSAVMTGSIAAATTITSMANITFGTGDYVAVLGALSNTASMSGVTYTNATTSVLNNSGNISLGWTGATLANTFAVGTVSNSASFTGALANGNNNGNIQFLAVGAAAASTITTGAITNNTTLGSTSNLTNCGMVDFRAIGSAAVTAASVTASGSYAGAVQFGIGNVTVTGAVSNDRTQTTGTVATAAATSGTTFTAGSIVVSNKGIVALTSSVDAAITVTGAVTVSGTGSLTAANLVSGNLGLGTLAVSGTGVVTLPGTGTVTIGGTTIAGGTTMLATGIASLGSLTQSAGTLNIGTGNPTTTIGTANFQVTGGTLNLGTGIRTMTISGVSNMIGNGSGNPSFTATNTTLQIGTPNPIGVITLTMGSQNPVWPGLLTVNNTSATSVFPVAVVLTGGNLALTNAAGLVTFQAGGVQLNGTKLYIASSTGAADFQNIAGYTTINNGYVSIANNAGNPQVSGAGSFGDFEVNSLAGTVTFAAATGKFIGNYYLTAGTVDGTNLVFNNTAAYPTIIRNAGVFTLAPTFSSRVNVTYIGTDKPTGLEIPTDSLYNLSVATTNGGNGAGTNVFGKGVATRGVVTITSGTVNGALTVNAGQVLALANGATLTMNGATAQVDGDIVNLVTGGTLVLNGAAGTVVSGAGLLPPVTVAAGSLGNVITGSRGLADVQLAGDFTIGGGDVITATTSVSNANLVFGNGNAALTATFSGITGIGTHVANITTANAGNVLTLGANLVANDKLTHAAGTINVADFKLTLLGNLTGSQDFTGGAKVIGAGTLEFKPGIANTINVLVAADTLDANVSVIGTNGLLTLAAANQDLVLNGTLSVSGANGIDIGAGRMLTARGTTVTMASGTAFSGTGTLKLDAAVAPLTFSYAGAPTLVNLTINNDVVLAGAGTSLTVTGAFAHSGGDLNFASRTLTSSGAYTRTNAATYSATTGYFVSSGTFNQGTTDFTIPNLRLSGATPFGSTGVLTVTKALDLSGGLYTITNTSAVRLAVSDLATVNYTSGSFDAVPTYLGTISLNALINGTIGANVWPAAPTTLVTTLKVMSAGSVTLPGARTVNNTLDLSAGVLSTSAAKVTLVDSATIRRTENGSVTAGSLVFGAAMNNVYEPTSASAVTTGPELASTVNNMTVTRSANVANAALTLNAPVTVNGTLTIKNDFSTPASALTLNGNMVIALDSYSNATNPSTNFGAPLTFGGAATQTVTLNGTRTISNLLLNKTNSGVVNVGGGDLRVSGQLTFANGVLAMADPYAVVLLSHGLGSQGYDHTGVVYPAVSHIAGKVRVAVAAGDGMAGTNGRFEFPTGTATKYRPMAITFTPGYPANNPTSIEAKMVDTTAAGTYGLPVDDGTGVKVGGYPNYYWLVNTTPSPFSNTQKFDVELQGTNLGYAFTRTEDLRIIRRQDGNAATNKWDLQGLGINYVDNYVRVDGVSDSVLFVRSSSSTGGIVNAGTRFTIGIPTRPPVFTSVTPDTSVNEGDSLMYSFQAASQNIGGGTITYSLVAPLVPNTTINATTGAFKFKPDYAQAGVVTVTVGAYDGQFTAEKVVTITVNNMNRAPKFTAPATAATVKSGTALSLTYAATDADAQTVTFSLADGFPTGMSINATTGAVAWTPTFLQSPNTYIIKVYASDGIAKDSATTTITVTRAELKGDINNDLVVGVVDASLALQHAAGLAVLTDTVKLWAGDVSGNGFVTAYDASLILRKVAGEAIVFAPKMGKAYSGSVSFGQAVSAEANVLTIPVKISNAQNITSVQFTLNIDAANATFKGVTTSLPKDWVVFTSNVEGKVSVAMAGVTPVSSSDIAAIAISMKDKSASINVSGEGFVNEADVQSLSLDNVRMLPSEYALDQNYPNPFNPSTTIKYQLTQDSKVSLTIYNVQGQVVRTLVNDNVSAGYQSVSWNGKNEMGQTVASGMYMYRIQAGSFVSVKKMLMLK